MNYQAPIREILFRRYTERRQANPHYSLHAFSKRIGISSGALSGILNGTRQISKKMALKIAKTLSLDPPEWERFLSPFTARETSELPNGVLHYETLEIEQHRAISEWHHFAILSLVKLEDFEPNARWIARRLALSEAKATQAISRLFKLGLLKEVGGRWERSPSRYSTTDDVANPAVREAHRRNLELAGERLADVPIDLRDFTSMTFAVDPAQLAELKKIIRSFQDGFVAKAESGRKKEVYRLLMNLFPLTQLPKKEAP